ncbi:MAG TPA: hypothetical protein VHB46_03020 [Burkholderiales bacterium]|nr:hypothetical protein [Burkholderiales bacterium]
MANGVRVAQPTGLSRALLAAIVLTVVIGLLVDRYLRVPGQVVVSVWTWGMFLVLLARVNRQVRLPLLLCLVISTAGECALSLGWGLYTYWLHNVPFFVPPGHVLLFAFGLTVAPRMPRWGMLVTTSAAAGYGVSAYLTSIDTLSVPFAILFLAFMAFGSNRKLYATMFLISLVMELYGTWLGNWKWSYWVPGLPLTSSNPPICVGALYCALDLAVVNADRLLRKWRQSIRPPMRTDSVG